MQLAVLIIEDSKVINKFVHNGLAKIGYNCDSAFTLSDALLAVQKKRYDAIILDLLLPDGEGDDILNRLEQAKCRTIVLSSLKDKDRRDVLFRNGILDFFDKEMLSKETLLRISGCIQRAVHNSGTSILIVDDSSVARNGMQKLLINRGYTVYTAQESTEAFNILEKQTINLALIDLELPGINGDDILRKLKKEAKYSDIPVFMVSATNNPEVIGECLRHGAADFLRKPYIAEELVRKVDFWIDYTKKDTRVSRSEKLLNEYKMALDNSAIVSKTDIHGVITYANEQFCLISGYSQTELVGKSHNIVRHPDMPKEAFTHLWQTILAKKTWGGIIKNRKKDGSTYVVQSTITPILNEEGEIEEFIGVRYDITQLEHIKEDLQSRLGGTKRNLDDALVANKQLESALEKAALIIRSNKRGAITYANERFCTVSGFSATELIGRRIEQLLSADVSKTLLRELRHSVAKGFLYQGVLKFSSKNGKPFILDTIIAPISLHNEIVEYVQISTDITEVISLHHELEDTQKELLYRIGEIGETRDKETGNHVKRVAEYSKLLARKYGLTADQCELIYASAPMHDIGKIAIPDTVLLKPGKLDKDEFETMKTHTLIGWGVLKGSSRELLRASSIIAKQHHEKYDGSGYPNGLKGEEIHIFGRIVAIADVFDALSSERPYKEAWELERIVSLLETERGKQFDPVLIDIFLHNLTDFVAIKEQFADTPAQ